MTHAKNNILTLVTVMDYSKKNEIDMCKIWIYLAKRFNPSARIYIFYCNKHRINKTIKYSLRYEGIKFIRLNTQNSYYLSHLKGDNTRSIKYKIPLWEQCASLKLHSYIYLDADAFILSPLNEWWDRIKIKPFIGIAERVENSVTLCNAGVYSYSNSTNFIAYDKLIQQYHHDGGTILLPTGDQGLINSYFKTIKYTYTDKTINYTYNCFAKRCITVAVNDKKIIIYSGLYPFWKRLRRRMKNIPVEWWEGWLWWNKPSKVKVLHAYGEGLKFWELKECRALWNYCLQKVSE